MSLTAIIPAIVAFAGLLMWMLLANPKAQEIGKLMFFAGLLATCFALSGETVHLGKGR